MNEKLEKLNRELAKGEARLRRAQHEEKILKHQIKQLTRKERTHRLCTRGAMLESFLIRPEVLTDDDVMDILKQAFSQTGMKEVVAESVKGRVGPIITGEATLPLRWLPPATPLWTCRPETPCAASCFQSTSFQKSHSFLWADTV